MRNLVYLSIFLSFYTPLTLAYSPPTNKQLIVGYTQELETLHPHLVSSAYAAYAVRILNRSLFNYGPKGKVPQIVTKVPSLENGLAQIHGEGKNKRLVSTWTIRENAKWGDGTPITAKDIKFSWQVATNPSVATTVTSEYQRVHKVRQFADNPKKFEFVHSQIEWNYSDIDFFALPAHLEEPIYKKDPKKYLNKSLYINKPETPGLYSGPYLVKELKLGSHLVVIPNPFFYGKKPTIKSIVYQIVPHSAAIDSHLRSGNIHMAAPYALSIEQGATLEQRYKNENIPLQLNSRPGIFTDGLYLNPKHVALADPLVRSALSMSVRREGIAKGIFMGKQDEAHGFIAPSQHFYPPGKFPHSSFSLRKARALIEKAGWKRNKKGIFVKDGKPLRLIFKTAAGKRDRERVQVYLKQQFTQLGIQTEIKNEPVRVLYGESLPKGNFDLLLGATGFNGVTSPEVEFHSKNIPSRANNFHGQNRFRWKNKHVDKLSLRYSQEFNQKKRQEILAKIMTEFVQDVPWIPLYHLSEISMTPTNLKGYQLLGNGYPPTEFVEMWEIEGKTE